MPYCTAAMPSASKKSGPSVPRDRMNASACASFSGTWSQVFTTCVPTHSAIPSLSQFGSRLRRQPAVVEAVARLVDEHVGEGGRVVAAVAGHDHAAVAPLVADAVGALRVGLHEPGLERGVVLLVEKRHHQALALPDRLPARDAVEVAEQVVHRVEVRDVRSQLGRGDVARHEELVGLRGLQRRERRRRSRRRTASQRLDLGGMLRGREPRPRPDAAGLHAGDRLGGLAFGGLATALAAALRSRLPPGLRLVDRLSAGHDPGDGRQRRGSSPSSSPSARSRTAVTFPFFSATPSRTGRTNRLPVPSSTRSSVWPT